MRFSSQLQHLNASVTSAQKAAQYAIKYKDMDEDLHSCIIEQIEKNNMNTRANIMYFIEHFLEMATKERHNDYARMMQRDIIRVVDAVCPEDGSGAANVKVVRKVLQGLLNKSLLPNQTVGEIEECLKERDTFASDIGLSSPVNGDIAPPTDVNTHPNSRSRNGGSSAPNGLRLDKRQIEQRIEEDRERHKRMRESMWTVPAQFSDEATKLYDETSDTGEDDHILGEEELDEIRHESIRVPCYHQRNNGTNGVSTH
ncbi:putative ctd kinase subunit gamma protein [Eutypa lata UCREL1]|uniref:Putative ctd kinase subunit gamma protein n=1 Tax=Eutypa lata (strain UCR-EL1) TaxID=1287681 RepID=M7S5V5_EUTLA|nr:putative ctd kinase subunit gamma protein [Eutypa lata UCREL1]